MIGTLAIYPAPIRILAGARKMAALATKAILPEAKHMVLGAALLAVPDGLLRLYVNRTIPAVDSKVNCIGTLVDSGQTISWLHIPFDRTFDYLSGRFAQAMCQPFPPGRQLNDFSIPKRVLDGRQIWYYNYQESKTYKTRRRGLP